MARPTDLAGPTFFFQRFAASTADDGARAPYVLTLNAPLQRVDAQAMRAEASLDPSLDLDGASVDVASIDPAPSSVNQVWVASRMLDTPASAPVYTLRSADSRFVGAAPSGTVTASAEARGPLEQWTVLPAPSGTGVQLRAPSGNLLGLDEVAGGKVVVRADSTDGAG